ncbi:MAG: hypothetical protein HC840_32330 [Leptolyngbyaceae cyanobacterium RM2_2_4]|nr:hypothetical protein [Leptolyngbyaceae cyanobacterium RM2_2_4]
MWLLISLNQPPLPAQPCSQPTPLLSVKQLRTQTTSYLVSEWLNASFATPQYILKDVVQSVDLAEVRYPSDNPSQHLERTNRLINQAILYEKIQFLGIFDQNCTVTHTSIGINLGRNFKQREYCKLVSQKPLEAFKTSNMFRSITGRMNITVSYPVLGPSHIAILID